MHEYIVFCSACTMSSYRKFTFAISYSDEFLVLTTPRHRRERPFLSLKSHLAWRKSAAKFLCVKTVSGKAVGHSLAYLSIQQWPRWSEIADFRFIFSRSASAVTPCEKSSINTNRKSTTRFPMSLRWSSYVAPKSPKGWLCNAVSKIWTISCDISETVRDRMSVTINHL